MLRISTHLPCAGLALYSSPATPLPDCVHLEIYRPDGQNSYQPGASITEVVSPYPPEQKHFQFRKAKSNLMQPRGPATKKYMLSTLVRVDTGNHGQLLL
jgi:hypothetical protein